MSEDIYYIVLFAGNWARRGDPLKKVMVAPVVDVLGLCVLGLCWKFLEKPSVYFTLIELVGARAAVFWRATRLNLGVIFTSRSVVLGLSVKQKLAWGDSLPNTTHFATLIEQSKAFPLVLTILGMCHLSQNLFSCNWRFFWCVFFITASVVEWAVWIVLASDSENAAG